MAIVLPVDPGDEKRRLRSMPKGAYMRPDGFCMLPRPKDLQPGGFYVSAIRPPVNRDYDAYARTLFRLREHLKEQGKLNEVLKNSKLK